MLNKFLKFENLLGAFLLASLGFLVKNFCVDAMMPSNQNNQAFSLFVDKKPNLSLLKLLDICEVKHDGTLKDIVNKTQNQWLRKDNQEKINLNI